MEKTYLQEVGERLLECRNRSFFSRQELAKKSGVSVHTIITMEKGEQAIGIDAAVKICNTLGYSIEYILTGNCGFLEFIRMNQKLLELPNVHPQNLQKIASAFWQTCPRYYR